LIANPFLRIAPSTLGTYVGMGLFATRDITLVPGDANPLILCAFFGKVLFLNEMDLLEEHWNDDVFQGGSQGTQIYIQVGPFVCFLKVIYLCQCV
jgi:hypothetical protein